MAFVRKHSGLFAVLAVFATAGLFLAGNGMVPVWPLMWIAPLPVLLMAAEAQSWRVAGAGAALSFLLGGLTMLHYLHVALHAPVTAWLIPFSIASIIFAAGVLLFRALLRRGAGLMAALALPALWTCCEYAASFVPANGTAGSLAYSQEGFLPILQVASLTGPWGITFLLLLFPSAVAAGLYLRQRNPRQAALVVVSALTLVAGAVVFGALRLAATPGAQQSVKVGLLDTDTVDFAKGAAMQQLVARYAEEAEKIARQGAQIVVMPEKTGVLTDSEVRTADPLFQSVADRTGATLVFGLVHVAGKDSFNQARIYTSGQPIATYDKQHMLPPFESDLTPGTSLTLLPKSAAPIGVAICKDMDFIHPALDYGRRGIDLLLDPAWDFHIDAVWHGHIAIMRGVEGGYAIAHAAKDGLLTVTDDRGRILGEVKTGGAGFTSLLVDVPLRHDVPVFDRFGTWFAWVAGVLLLMCVGRLALRSGGQIARLDV
jgi:apolipoprotein N-acyltransferase